ncbi:MAG: phosphoribosylaminoimidazolesuccinocarboxamide synthase [Phycisphaeraceae bacterium]|nr:phosphoribosylaminoimidazolesuccinocarboxamide synthase [Phycisphaeraceae bacterium]
MPPAEPTQGATIAQTRLALPLLHRGKVREVYSLGHDRVAIIATDRLSAFDVVLPTPIPGKGRVLTALSAWWFRWLQARGLGPTHFIADEPDLPQAAFALPDATPRADLAGRTTIARRGEIIRLECVVRGYLEGSGWKDYRATGRISSIALPAGLRQCDRLPEPIFTPSTKAEPPEHDEPISFEQAAGLLGADLVADLRERSLAIYNAAAEHALSRGIILADTKFEFAWPVDREKGAREPMLADEALTPDSSRFWPADQYAPGRSQASFDKQYVREYLMGLVEGGLWDKSAPGPLLPADVVAHTAERYEAALGLLAS